MNRTKVVVGWKVALTAISLLGVLCFKGILPVGFINAALAGCDSVRGMLYDMAIGLLSALILVWLIDCVEDIAEKREERERAVAAVLRADNVMTTYIARYTLLFYCVCTPLEKRDFSNVALNVQFSFRDMADLHKTTLLINEGLGRSSARAFLDYEEMLKGEIERTLLNVDYSCCPTAREALQRFARASLEWRCADAVKSFEGLCKFDEGLEKACVDMLLDKADKWYESGSMPESNQVQTYHMLRELMREEGRALLDYESDIRSLERESDAK